MLRLPEENIEYVWEYTKKMLRVFAFALVLAFIIGIIIWHCGRTDNAVSMYEQELNREKAVEQLAGRMR